MGLGSDNELVALWDMVGKGQVTVRGSQHYSVTNSAWSLKQYDARGVMVLYQYGVCKNCNSMGFGRLMGFYHDGLVTDWVLVG